MTFSVHISEALFRSPVPIIPDLCQATLQGTHTDETNAGHGAFKMTHLAALNLCVIIRFRSVGRECYRDVSGSIQVKLNWQSVWHDVCYHQK